MEEINEETLRKFIRNIKIALTNHEMDHEEDKEHKILLAEYTERLKALRKARVEKA